MLKPKPLFAAILLMGAAGGILRAVELRYVYDTETGLPSPMHPVSLALVGVILAAFAVSLVFAVRHKPSHDNRNLQGARVPLVIAALILACGSIADIAEMMTYEITLAQMALAGLGLLTALMLLLMATTVTSRLTHGLFATIAVFWSCFWFLLLFAGNAGNPVLGQFLYEFVGVMLSVLAFYFFTGCHFDRARPRLLAFSLAMGLFFVTLTLLGVSIAWLFFQEGAMLDNVTLSGLLRLLFAAIYMLSIPTLIRRVQQMPVDAPRIEQDPDDDEED